MSDAHHHRDGERGDDPDDQVLQRVDVLDDAGQQVAPPEGGQPGRGQPLEPLVDPHPEVGQQPEGGVVADQPLLVAEEAAGEPEELHTDDGHGQRATRWGAGPPSRSARPPCR